ncbi:unnamed protein product [Rhizophagus irregularis]|nr:unnamed protein product [Rhizophagus irregularis]
MPSLLFINDFQNLKLLVVIYKKFALLIPTLSLCAMSHSHSSMKALSSLLITEYALIVGLTIDRRNNGCQTLI